MNTWHPKGEIPSRLQELWDSRQKKGDSVTEENLLWHSKNSTAKKKKEPAWACQKKTIDPTEGRILPQAPRPE